MPTVTVLMTDYIIPKTLIEFYQGKKKAKFDKVKNTFLLPKILKILSHTFHTGPRSSLLITTI